MRRSDTDRIRPCHLFEKRGYPQKVMFWGCLTVFGPGVLIPVNGTMRSDDYIHILSTHLIPLARACYGNSQWYLQQDNASCHTSITSRLAMQSMRISILPWPANSPDMNCIENAWGLLKRKLYARGSGRTRADVICNAQDIWMNDNDFRDKCRQMVLSMPNRVSQLYINKGRHTTY